MISLLLAVLSAAPAPTVEVRLAPGPVTVGDHVEATLAVATAHGDLTGPPRFPVWRETWGEAEIVRAESPRETRSADGDALWTQRLVLRAFRPGTIRLPRVAVALPLADGTIQARTPEGAALTVRSVLPPGVDPKKSEPEPAEPMRQLPVGAAFWWTAGILSALCLAAGRRVWRPRRGPLTAPGRPAVLPPFAELASELSQAASAPPLDAHVRLSWALRRYLGRVLQVPAVYSTTSQIQLQLLSRRLPGPLVRRAVELLRACDLVKFARGEAGAGQTAERLLAAREIGREIEERFAPAVRPCGAGGMSGLPHLADPAWLALLLAAPLLAWRHHRRPQLGPLTYSRLPVGTAGAWRLHLPFYTRLLALCCFAVALARPQLGYTWEESLTEGIDIQIALDVSGSMGAEDFKPKNRLTVAKQVLRRFVAGRPADRIGLVVFSGSTFTRSPLTTDRRMLDFLLDSVELSPVPDGTAIGVALASAAARLEDSTAKTRVVLLVTDGVNTGGEIDPLSAAALCKGLGLKVYTVGVGAKQRVAVPMPVSDPVSGERRTESFFINAGVDEPLLRRIAGKTGGRFYKATDRQSLERIFADIDRLEKTPMKVRRYVRYREAFAPFAWAGAGLLLVPLFAAALRATGEP